MGIQKVPARSDYAEVEDNSNYYNYHFQEDMEKQPPLRDDRNTNACMEAGLEQRTAVNAWG